MLINKDFNHRNDDIKKYKPNKEVFKIMNDSKFNSDTHIVFESLLRDEVVKCPFRTEKNDLVINKDSVVE